MLGPAYYLSQRPLLIVCFAGPTIALREIAWLKIDKSRACAVFILSVCVNISVCIYEHIFKRNMCVCLSGHGKTSTACEYSILSDFLILSGTVNTKPISLSLNLTNIYSLIDKRPTQKNSWTLQFLKKVTQTVVLMVGLKLDLIPSQ